MATQSPTHKYAGRGLVTGWAGKRRWIHVGHYDTLEEAKDELKKWSRRRSDHPPTRILRLKKVLVPEHYRWEEDACVWQSIDEKQEAAAADE